MELLNRPSKEQVAKQILETQTNSQFIINALAEIKAVGMVASAVKKYQEKIIELEIKIEELTRATIKPSIMGKP